MNFGYSCLESRCCELLLALGTVCIPPCGPAHGAGHTELCVPSPGTMSFSGGSLPVQNGSRGCILEEDWVWRHRTPRWATAGFAASNEAAPTLSLGSVTQTEKKHNSIMKRKKAFQLWIWIPLCWLLLTSQRSLSFAVVSGWSTPTSSSSSLWPCTSEQSVAVSCWRSPRARFPRRHSRVPSFCFLIFIIFLSQKMLKGSLSALELRQT